MLNQAFFDPLGSLIGVFSTQAWWVLAPLLLVAFTVGALMGAVGVGGILLLPAIVWIGGRGIHTAAATVLFSLIFSGLLGMWLHRRNGALDWSLTVPLCLTALAFSIPGVWVAYQLGGRTLTSVVALTIVFVGVNVFAGLRRSVRDHARTRGRSDLTELCATGALSGFGSGLSGAGGPLFSVPIMMLLGYPPLVAVGTSQTLQVVAAAAGSVAHLELGDIDYGLALPITLVQLAGLRSGARYARSASAVQLRALTGTACLIIGSVMLYRSL